MACRALALERNTFLIRRPECSPGAGLSGLVQLLNGQSADSSDLVGLRARQVLRSYVRESAQNQDALATIWQDKTGTSVPEWLALSAEVLDAIASWLATPTWSDSCDYWSEHADVLSSAEAAVALAEYVLVSPEGAAQHEALRERILANGVSEAFRPFILGDQLAEWTECDTWEESEQFLRAHTGLLSTGLPASPSLTHAALLHVARTRDIAAAYALVRDRSHLQDYVQRALTAGDAEALLHASAIEGEVFSDPLSSLTHAQSAQVLAGAVDDIDPDDLAALAADASPDLRNRLLSEIATLSAMHAHQHAALWVRIIQVLAKTA